MPRFLTEKIADRLRWIFLCILFLAFYFYFFSFNKFHLFYVEQTQLFRFSGDYFRPFLEKPGELVFYLGEFLSQFFVNPYLAAGIVTLLAVATYFLTHFIFEKLGINALVLSFIPVLFIAGFQSNHLFKIGLIVGVILALSFSYLYLRLTINLYRYIIGSVAWLLLYVLSGSFALFASVLIVLFELFYFNSKKKWIVILAIVLLSIGIPYLGWKFYYLIPFADAWFYPLPFWGVSRMPLFAALLLYFPVVVLVLSGYRQIRKKEALIIPWNYASILAGSAIIIAGIFVVKTKAYDPKIEIFLGMDHYVQAEDWNKVISLSKKYQGTNQLVMYYTNLALYKTGQFSTRMFDFPQRGIDGLRLEWTRDEVTPFFGGEIFYHLNYVNEAYRWAFESMVAKGLNPRSLKRLVQTSLINGQYEVASKYLNVLDQTLFYKDWATKYRTYVLDPAKISQNKELAEKMKFLAKNDFISYDLGLPLLLKEHPENKMAFEYLMAVFLLNKDITSFAANIYRLKELGYREIPVNYEEALLFCMTYFKRDLVPEGFSIRQATIQRKNEYIAQISRCGGDRDRAAKELYKQFGNTCWYYLHFAGQTQN
ncbi:MAG: DUF6057 family protein [Prolixibacteraceae bacterium]|nr:DUF6057 family protein [Prolixibacteraceae bacterium]